VINERGEVLANRNVPNGTQPVLGVIGGLPSGTPVAFEAAFGWGWLVELLEDYGFDPHYRGTTETCAAAHDPHRPPTLIIVDPTHPNPICHQAQPTRRTGSSATRWLEGTL
jgi:hypothetical protein